MARVAFIGLGNMGGPMAANLAGAGHAVTAFDLVPAALEAARAAGAAIAESTRAAVVDAEFVVTMLPAGRHVEGVLDQEGNGCLLDEIPEERWSSIARRLPQIRRVRDRRSEGRTMLDAPVSGGVGGAQAAR